MKTMRIITWLVVVALLTALCPAFGEETDNGELEENTRQETLTIEADGSEEAPGEIEGGLLEMGEAGDVSSDELLAGEASTEANAAEANAAPEVRHISFGEGWDNDALFAGYVDLQFGRIAQKNGFIGDTLTGYSKKMYDFLEKKIKKVASGELSSTVFKLPDSYMPVVDYDILYAALWDVIDAILYDFPYHLYWFDKTRGLDYRHDKETNELYLVLYVEEEYARSDFETDLKKTRATQAAVRNASALVAKCTGLSDYRKLCAYRDYILDAVKYNYEVSRDPAPPYGNHSQLIWVFDGDPGTDVMCEGYSKAFQYLCDMSVFKGGIRCFSVGGYAGRRPEKMARKCL